MTTKSKNLLRSLLLIPYSAWVITLLFDLLVRGLASNPDAPNAFFNALVDVASFYTVGIVVWGIPYTILAVGLLLWSINKPAPNIYKVFIFSPFLLSILMVIEVALISFWHVQALSHEDLMSFLSSTLLVVIPSLIFGYGFVGIGSIVYKAAMKRLNLINADGGEK
jgi:hypothetical protein